MLHAVTDAITRVIDGMGGGNPEKYTYLNNRLEFEKEEAEKKRQHEEKLESRREKAERVMAAQCARKTFMLQLLQVAFSRAGNTSETNQGE